MITTAASRDYTSVALHSFFACTPLIWSMTSSSSTTMRISCCRTACRALGSPWSVQPRRRVSRATPTCAWPGARRGADLFLLNNDLVFTTGWLEPMLADRQRCCLRSRMRRWCTRPARCDPARHGPCGLPRPRSGARSRRQQHRAHHRGFQIVSSIGVLCIKIRASVYQVDRRLRRAIWQGRDEDRDYALRAWLAGIRQKFALGSYVLHFRESRPGVVPKRRSSANYATNSSSARFKTNGVRRLTHAFLIGDWNLFRVGSELAAWLAQGLFTPLVTYLRAHPCARAIHRATSDARFAGTLYVIDADEIHEMSQLQAAMTAVRHTRQSNFTT